MSPSIAKALEEYAKETTINSAAPSAVSSLIDKHLPVASEAPDHALALQVFHNLQHEHNWTGLLLHTKSPYYPFAALPRPLISGLAPHRLYMHPDEQIELLKEAKKRNKAEKEKKEAKLEGTGAEETSAKHEPAAKLDLQAQPEREWVLPTRLNEKWSLKRMAEIFDAIGLIPPESDGDAGKVQAPNGPSTPHHAPSNKWRTSKRVLMAMADHDSTIVYYIVQEGIVKPRQN